MKLIVCVNSEIPTIDHNLAYTSDGSLRDYDIVVFNPTLPWFDRIEFSGGGSCITVDGTARLLKAMSHWSRELKSALQAGKTIFVVLSAYKEDQGATGSTTPNRSSRTYQTTTINNYSIIPGNLKVRNASGRTIFSKDSSFKNLHKELEEIFEYRIIFESYKDMKVTFTAKDGTPVGGIINFDGTLGKIVLIPYFNFESSKFVELVDDKEIWSEKALKTSNALVGQLIAIDRMLKEDTNLTPTPSWVKDYDKPLSINKIDYIISEIDNKIKNLEEKRKIEVKKRNDLSDYSHLLYENGTALEKAIENTLKLIGYSVETVRVGDLEIDHVVVGPSGKRMIGESEGKDSSAIDITKFRQLESNIGEDFEREDVCMPAKGLLFGNGYRLTAPESRAEQFTQKSLTNANRLGSALIRTTDLYSVALYVIDNPDNEDFKKACREAIENTSGGIVVFPSPS